MYIWKDTPVWININFNFFEKNKKIPPIEDSVEGELTELLIGGWEENSLYKALNRLPLVYQIIHKVYSHYLLF